MTQKPVLSAQLRPIKSESMEMYSLAPSNYNVPVGLKTTILGKNEILIDAIFVNRNDFYN